MVVNNQPRSFQYWNGINATPADFNLDAGLYGLGLTAGAWGTAALQKLLPDGITYVPLSGGTLAGDSYVVMALPAGQYRLALTGITALIGAIELVARGVYR